MNSGPDSKIAYYCLTCFECKTSEMFVLDRSSHITLCSIGRMVHNVEPM